jgi:hypothetical protein
MNYYIKGNKDKADQIKAAFDELGISADGYDFSSKDVLYFTYEVKGETYMMSALLDTGLDKIILTHPDYKELELPVEPCFKVGDKIEATIYGIKRRVTIRQVDRTNRCYFGTLEECIGFSEQDQWHLATKPHYDISNFKPFDKVLVRCGNDEEWMIEFYCKYDTLVHTSPHRDYPFMGIGDSYPQCIPFEGNEHLLGTADPCDDMYINW